MKYRFIEQNRFEISVVKMCQTLRVSRSGFYSWLNRDESKREYENSILKKEIVKLFQEHKGRVGNPSICAELHFQERFSKLRACSRAIVKRNPPKGLMIHSDRGVQYASKDFRNKLKYHGFI